MSDTAKQKRPTSHRWAIGLFAFMTAGFAIFLMDMFRGRSGVAPGPYWSPIVILSVGAIAFAALVLGGRQRWAYYISSGALAVWAGRGVYTLLWYVYYFFVRGDSVSTPYFHLAERQRQFVVQQQVSMGKQLLIAVMVGLLIWLFVRFTFGHPSRRYYGFYDVEKF
jgi:hypothetical protein